MRALPESKRFKNTLTLVNVTLERGPRLTDKQRGAVGGKEKASAEKVRENNYLLAKASTTPFYWDGLTTELGEEPFTLNLPDDIAALLPLQVQTFLSDEQQDSLVSLSLMFNLLLTGH